MCCSPLQSCSVRQNFFLRHPRVKCSHNHSELMMLKSLSSTNQRYHCFWSVSYTEHLLRAIQLRYVIANENCSKYPSCAAATFVGQTTVIAMLAMPTIWTWSSGLHWSTKSSPIRYQMHTGTGQPIFGSKLSSSFFELRNKDLIYDYCLLLCY